MGEITGICKEIKELLLKLDCKDDSWKYDARNDQMLKDFNLRKMGKRINGGTRKGMRK